MLISGELGYVATKFIWEDEAQIENQKKISEFQDKLNHAKELQAEQYAPSQNTQVMPPDWGDPRVAKEIEISGDITTAESDLDWLKRQYVKIEDLRDDPNGYGEYVEQQERFDETAEHFEKYADEALDGLRDPQTFAGDVREVGRDIKDGAVDFFHWLQGQ